MKKYKLGDIATLVTDKIKSDKINLKEYVTTDSILQNKRGREIAQNLPPVICSLTRFIKGDILVANIRPYLKKIWYADSDGGCSSDVLVFRAKKEYSSQYLYSVLLQDSFFDYTMKGAKGSKMPRGDKTQIMRYNVFSFTNTQQNHIGNLFSTLDRKISLNRAINQNLEAMAKQLYDYWFVQFDFPNEEGKPYKSSGGKMVWNEKLKREIPEGWECMPIGKYAPCKGGYAFKSTAFGNKGISVIKIGNIQENNTLDMDSSQCIENYDNPIFIAKRFDLVIALTGATIGKFAISQNDYLVNQRVGKFELGNNPLKRLGYIFNSMKQEYFREQIFQIASGCAQPNISTDQIDSINILKPEESLVFKYNTICEPILKKQVENIIQIEQLTKQRDELLPLLMNGQVSVNGN